ncbi:MAG TPA: hypothetical protein VFT27_07125 [Actinomycetota bacterium]|nr:hypothetical protein [Actinomycetota bacterium]
MSANTQILRERRPVRLPAWLVIGVALAIAGSLAVVSISEREPATRSPESVTVTGGSVARSEAAEMAELKSGVAQRYLAELTAAETSTTDWPLNVAPKNRGPVKGGGADQRSSPSRTFGRHS